MPARTLDSRPLLSEVLRSLLFGPVSRVRNVAEKKKEVKRTGKWFVLVGQIGAVQSSDEISVASGTARPLQPPRIIKVINY